MSKNILLLSIDGGGVRGKIAATILELLEKDLNKTIYDTFDFFAGTSTGALIILGFTANQHTAEIVSSLYSEENLKRIFDKSLWGYIPFRIKAKYNGQGKEQFLKELFKDKKFLDVKKNTIVTAYDFLNNKAVIFKNTGGCDSEYNPFVSEVANATTAAPSYFPTVLTSESNPRNLIDGSIIANNPSLCLVIEALKQGHEFNSIRLLSIGTGYKEVDIENVVSENWGGYSWRTHGLIEDFIIGDSSMAQYQCSLLLGDNYLRIDGHLEKASIDLDNISTKNLKELQELGVKWYEKYKENILSFIKSV